MRSMRHHHHHHHHHHHILHLLTAVNHHFQFHTIQWLWCRGPSIILLPSRHAACGRFAVAFLRELHGHRIRYKHASAALPSIQRRRSRTWSWPILTITELRTLYPYRCGIMRSNWHISNHIGQVVIAYTACRTPSWANQKTEKLRATDSIMVPAQGGAYEPEVAGRLKKGTVRLPLSVGHLEVGPSGRQPQARNNLRH